MRNNKWWNDNVLDNVINEELIQLRVSIGDRKIDRNWTTDLVLDYENIDKDMEEIPSILAFWSAVLAEAKRVQKLLDMQLDIRKSKILNEVKGQIESLEKSIRITNSDKQDLLYLDDKYVKLCKASINVESTVSKLFGIVEALKIKADNLRSFSAMKRIEIQNQ